MSKKKDILQPGDREFLDGSAAGFITIVSFALLVLACAHADLAGRIFAIVAGFFMFLAYLYTAWRKQALLLHLSRISWGLFLGVIVVWGTSPATITYVYYAVGFLIISVALGIAYLISAKKIQPL